MMNKGYLKAFALTSSFVLILGALGQGGAVVNNIDIYWLHQTLMTQTKNNWTAGLSDLLPGVTRCWPPVFQLIE